jgi:hypothetical protein
VAIACLAPIRRVIHRWSGGERSSHYRRAPGDFVAAGVLLRVATCARALCEKLLSFASPLLLYAEEIEAEAERIP